MVSVKTGRLHRYLSILRPRLCNKIDAFHIFNLNNKLKYQNEINKSNMHFHHTEYNMYYNSCSGQ